MESMEHLAGADGAPAVAITRRRVLIVISALLVGMFLAALDQTIVSTALPTIVGDLHGASRLAWVVTAYLLTSTVSTPLWGKLGDQYGRKVFFQAAIVLFILGSVLSGLSTSMEELIGFRAIQGLGAGGLMIGAQTILGDVVSPRDRGRYMGLFTAMFGVTTVVGPLIGGVFVEYLSWRWIFYINVPVGAVAMVVTGLALPGRTAKAHRVIDYLGTVLLALGASALVLFTSLGGVTYPWLSPPIIALLVGGVVLTVLFVLAERRAAEPVMPLQLFRNRVFVSSSAIGFVAGFVMFGAMTFIPLYLQVVEGVSPTSSGLRLLPMMSGFLVASVGSGQLVSRWGRYKIFPVVGSALAALGLYLLSLVGPATSAWAFSGAMFTLGIGMGLVMQVLVVAVQNAVPYEYLGVGTSGTTFFRMIGSSFGTAVFGAIYAGLITGNLARSLHGVSLSKQSISQIDNARFVRSLPPAVHEGVVQAVAHTVQTVFLIAVPLAVVAFLLTWMLPEVPLRRSIRSTEPGEGFSPPEARSSLATIELALERAAARENRADVYAAIARRAGLEVHPASAWLLFRLEDGPRSLEQVAGRAKVDPERLAPGVSELVTRGLAVGGANGRDELELTTAGRAAVEKLTAARRAGMTELLEGWDPEEHPEVVEMVRRVARALMADDEKLLADVRSAAVGAA